MCPTKISEYQFRELVGACTGAVAFAVEKALNLGSEEGCVVVDEVEHCGRVASDGDMTCVLSDREGWVCA